MTNLIDHLVRAGEGLNNSKLFDSLCTTFYRDRAKSDIRSPILPGKLWPTARPFFFFMTAGRVAAQ
jgi:hypothetical protein